MRHEEILHRCFRCGWCKFTSDYSEFNCPSYRKFRFDTFAPGGRMWLIRAWLNGDIPNSARYQEILYSCATCGSCVEHCAFSFRDDLVEIFISAREEMVNDGRIPPPVRDFLKSINVHGNPFKAPEGERGAWAEGMPVEPYSDQDYLLYIGCVGSYDERGKKIAKALARLLSRAGVSFGILGDRELCDGNEVRALGETGLFRFLAESNIRMFRELGVRKIVTLDPHAYNAFRREYPGMGGDFEVLHYTQLLSMLVSQGSLSFSGFRERVVFHDPCYLGRHSGEYEAPREILDSIPGLERIEMRQSRENAFCCGGGGGNFFTDILGGGEESPNRIRIRQAVAAGAQVLAVACCQCAKMLEDGIKGENLEDRIRVLDIAEIALTALKG
ncbi:MAG: (Fe-S)-binding protein [Deltaproteobacteria bacterium]|nr:(Fe-S)-binding protein [Deltaproteobacteria bacterium]